MYRYWERIEDSCYYTAGKLHFQTKYYLSNVFLKVTSKVIVISNQALCFLELDLTLQVNGV